MGVPRTVKEIAVCLRFSQVYDDCMGDFKLGTKTGRFSCLEPNQANLPKSFDYGDLELRLVATAFPGADGIGADVEEIKDESCSDGSQVPSDE